LRQVKKANDGSENLIFVRDSGVYPTYLSKISPLGKLAKLALSSFLLTKSGRLCSKNKFGVVADVQLCTVEKVCMKTPAVVRQR
jgi:hypothetical protein